MVEEHPSQARLWQRIDEMCEPAIRLVTGEAGVTLPDVVRRVQQEQGATITPNRMWQRGDKTERYFEFNLSVDAVAAAYDRLVAVPETPSEPSQSPDEIGF